MINFSSAQYKNDNVLFKTLDPLALYKTLQNTNGYILLDVRSSGEFEDTSSFTGLNLGHLKGAININVRELAKRLGEIKADKDKPVFVYCSHSQRSRVASKLLADSGFTNVININGGLTSLHYLGEINKPYFKDLYETKNKFSFISPQELCDKINKNDGTIFLIDVRSDSLFKHIGSVPNDNAIGNIKEAINIPYEELKNNLNKIPKNKSIIITDLYGNEAAKAANLLLENGYKNIQVLVEGMDRWLTMNNNAACKDLYLPAKNYSVVSTIDFGKIKDKENVLLLDVRSTEEFNGTHKDYWRNIGKMKSALNIPFNEIENNTAKLEAYKNKPIIVYHFSGGPEAFAAAKYLSSHGFANVSVLYGGIFNVRWTAANINGQAYLKDFVTDIPDTNK
jgi:rhodanese-related sulfurtransferase